MTRSALTVFCDFDGTVTTRDVVLELLVALADPSWMATESEWEAGRISSRECLAKQIPLIRGGWPAIERVLGTVTLDPTFAGFAAWCGSHEVPLIIVSDGLDQVIRWLLARGRIAVSAIWANHLEVHEDGTLSITFPHPSRGGDCRAGLCKCQILEQAASCRVVVGDGLSDLCWASQADHCFAKGRLLASCRAQQIPCRPFEDFTTMQRALTTLLANPLSLAASFRTS